MELTLCGLLAVLPWVSTTQFSDSLIAPKQALLLLGAPILLASQLAARHVQLPASPWITGAFAGFAFWIVVVSVASPFSREAVLGWYAFRLGWTTWLAVVATFFAAASISGKRPGMTLVRRGGMVGLAVVTLAALGQETGAADALGELRMNARNTGLVGTPNDLAAYAILSLGFLSGPPSRRPALAVAVVSMVTLSVCLSQSRAGVACLALTLLLAPGLWIAAADFRRAFHEGKWLLTGALLGLLIALPTGTPAGILGRAGIAPPSGSDPGDLQASGSFRFELWEAGTRAAAARPVLGHGADSLPFVYGVHRQSSDSLDIYHARQVSSSHNAVIDILVFGGVPALLLLTAGVLAVVFPRLRSLRRDPAPQATALSALAGFGAMAMLNPLAIPQLVVFAVLLGFLTPALRMRTIPSAARASLLAGLALLFLAATAFTALLVRAEARAGNARDAYESGDYMRAATLYRSAAELMPLERRYRANAFLATVGEAATTDTDTTLDAAIAAGYELHHHFQPLAPDLVTLARLVYVREGDTSQVQTLLDAAAAAQPNSPRWAEAISQVRR